MLDRRHTDNDDLPMLLPVNAIHKNLINKGYGWDVSTEEKMNGLSVFTFDPSWIF